MSKYSKRLVHGTIIIFASMFLSALIGYGLKLVFARTLTVQNIGLFYSVLGFISFFVFVRDLGLSNSLIYFIPRFIVEKAPRKIKSSIVFAVFVQFILGFLFLIVLVLVSGLLTKYYFKESAARLLLIMLAIYYLTDSINEILFRTFQGFQNMFLGEFINVFFQLVSSILIIAFVLRGIDVKYFGFSYVVASILTGGVFFFIFTKYVFPKFNKTKIKITKKFREEMLAYSLPTMVGTVTASFYSQQTIFFLTLFVGLEAVGFYVMAKSLAKVSTYFFKATTRVFGPMMAELWKKKDMKNLEYYFNELINVSYLISVPIGFSIIFFSKEALRILYGEKFVVASQILGFFAIYHLIFAFIGILKGLFSQTGNPKLARNSNYFLGGVNIILNILLIPLFGLFGAVLSDVISVSLNLVYVIYIKIKRFPISINLKKLIKLAVSSLFFILPIFFLKKIIQLQPLFELILIISIAGSLYVFALFLMNILNFKKINNILKMTTNNKFQIPFMSEDDI